MFAARHCMMKIVETILFLDMSLAPIAWQL